MARGRVLSAVLLLALAANASATRSPAVFDQLCDTCLVATRILSDFLCDPAATELVLDMMEKQLCPNTPDPEQCNQISDALVPVLIQWLRASATPAEMCAGAGVCSTQLLPPRHLLDLHKPHQLKDGAECPLCTFVLNEAKAVLADPTTQTKVKEAARAACDKLPTDFQPTCTDMVDKYEALLVILVETADSTQACALMGLCVGTLRSMVPPAPLPLGLVRALHASRPRLEGALAQGPPLRGFGGPGLHPGSGFGPAPNSDMCSMCKLMVTEVDTLIENPAVQQDIEVWADTMCAKAGIPADWQQACMDMVHDYVPQLFAALISYVQPDPLCEGIHLCAPAPPPLAERIEGAFAKLASMVNSLFGALQGKSTDQLVGGFKRLQASAQVQDDTHAK